MCSLPLYSRVYHDAPTTRTLPRYRWRYISHLGPYSRGISQRQYEVSREQATVHYSYGGRSSASFHPLRYRCSLLVCDTRVWEVEVMKSKHVFAPGSGENVASCTRQKFRLVKGGNPQLILVHYCSGQAVRKSPSLSKIYPTLSTFPIHHFMKNSLKYRPSAKG